MKTPKKMHYLPLADILGSTVLGIVVVLVALFVPVVSVPLAMWLFVFLLLLACGLFSWKHEHAPKSVKGWLAYTFASMGVSILLFTLASGVAAGNETARFHAQLNIYAGLALCGAVVAVSGLVRFIFSQRYERLRLSE
jgi:hypothetical protein